MLNIIREHALHAFDALFSFNFGAFYACSLYRTPRPPSFPQQNRTRVPVAIVVRLFAAAAGIQWKKV